MSSQEISLQAESITLALSLPSDFLPANLVWNDASLLARLWLGEDIILLLLITKGSGHNNCQESHHPKNQRVRCTERGGERGEERKIEEIAEDAC
jgi:hypothetical protein